jgi:hypothetical protein
VDWEKGDEVMKRSILAGAWVSAALAAAVGMEVAQRYSRNANGVVVETAPVNATTTEIIEKPAAENGETPIAHALDSSTLDAPSAPRRKSRG